MSVLKYLAGAVASCAVVAGGLSIHAFGANAAKGTDTANSVASQPSGPLAMTNPGEPAAHASPPADSEQSPARLGDPISPADLRTLMRQASPYEQAVIADSVVTHDELVAAFAAADACIATAAEAAGNITLNPSDYSGEIPEFRGLSSADKDAFFKVGEAELGCVGTYYDHVLVGYGAAVARASRTDTAEVQRTGECLRQKGYQVLDDADWYDLALAVGAVGDDIPDFVSCKAQASRP